MPLYRMIIWLKLVFAVTELCSWSVIRAISVTWIEITSLRNTLHQTGFPNRTAPTSVGCIARCTATPGCMFVTYLSSTSVCYLHNVLQARQPIVNSRIWWKSGICKESFVYNNDIGVCVYLGNTIKVTWYTARQDCEGIGGRLIVTDDVEKLDAVVGHYNGNARFWVGGSTNLTLDTTQTLRWITGEEVTLPLDDYYSYSGSGDTSDTDISGTDTFYTDTSGTDTFGIDSSGTELCLALANNESLQKLTPRLQECDILSYYLCEHI